jgi:murein L,D-transpeptidase YafK
MKSRIIIGVMILAVMGLFSFSIVESRIVKKRLFNSNPEGVVYIIIDKSDYELQVYDDEGWYATYPVVFGNKSLADKMVEGDRKTPEGSFKIINKRPHEKWHKMMGLDYPTKESWEKFKQRKAQGIIPANAKIGGGIAIHGTWPNDDLVVDDYTNWTQGCIALRNEDLDEIFEYVPIGTKVIIRQ